MIASLMEWLLVLLIIALMCAFCGYLMAAFIATQEIDPETWTNSGIISQKLRAWRIVAVFFSALLSLISDLSDGFLWWLKFVAYPGFAFWIVTEVLWAYRYLRSPGEKLPPVTLYAQRVCCAAGFFVAMLLLFVIVRYDFKA